MALNDSRSKALDRLVFFAIVVALLASIGLLVRAYLNGESIGPWIWDRHQHPFSWYSRPLFLIPACYYAYRQRLLHVIGLMLCLVCSLFWFNAPDAVPSHVQEYLEWEKQLFFINSSPWPLIGLSLAVAVFLVLLFYAFWQQSFLIGLVLINAGTLLKILVSVTFGESAGKAAIIPSLSSLAIINLLAWWLYRHRRHHQSN